MNKDSTSKKGLVLLAPQSAKREVGNLSKGFTLMELLIVIAILGILAVLVSGNLINSLKRGRDAKRKEDLQQIQKAIEMYYEDTKYYPPVNEVGFGSALKHPDPAIGKTYMQKLPKDPMSAYTYQYFVDSVSGGTDNAYRIYSILENNQDEGPGTKNPNGYDPECCSSCSGVDKKCKFGISSYNNTNDL